MKKKEDIIAMPMLEHICMPRYCLYDLSLRGLKNSFMFTFVFTEGVTICSLANSAVIYTAIQKIPPKIAAMTI